MKNILKTNHNHTFKHTIPNHDSILLASTFTVRTNFLPHLIFDRVNEGGPPWMWLHLPSLPLT
jgi:hypothetical protein